MRATFWAALLLFAGCTVSCFAQFETAAVLGTVRDPSGLVIPNAKIALRNVNTGVSATARTDATGNFEFLTVKIGDYRVSAEAVGFAPLTTDTFNVAVNARQRVDLTMQIGPTTQTLTVTDVAALTESDSSDKGQVIRPRLNQEGWPLLVWRLEWSMGRVASRCPAAAKSGPPVVKLGE